MWDVVSEPEISISAPVIHVAEGMWGRKEHFLTRAMYCLMSLTPKPL